MSEKQAGHPTVERVVTQLREGGIGGDVRWFDEATPTAAHAADALGVEVGAIANSLIFTLDGEPVLVLTSGAHRVDTAWLGEHLGGRLAAGGCRYGALGDRAGHRRSCSGRTPGPRAHVHRHRARRIPGSLGRCRTSAHRVSDHVRRTRPAHRRHADGSGTGSGAITGSYETSRSGAS